MLAGGSGITPMWQLMQLVLANGADNTALTLVYANTKEEDILLRPKLEALAADYEQLSLELILSDAPADWGGRSGRIDKAMMEDLLPGPSDDVLVCVCGPPAMYASLCGAREHADDLGLYLK